MEGAFCYWYTLIFFIVYCDFFCFCCEFFNLFLYLYCYFFAERMEGALYDIDNIRRCIVAGFFANAAYLHPSGTYRTVRDEHELHIHPSSVLYTEKPPQWFVFC